MMTNNLNPQFSACVDALMTLHAATDDAHHECDAWHAPTECHTLIERNYERDVAEALDDYGFTIDTFWAEVHKRGLSPRWQYDHIPPIEFIN